MSYTWNRDWHIALDLDQLYRTYRTSRREPAVVPQRFPNMSHLGIALYSNKTLCMNKQRPQNDRAALHVAGC